MKNIKYIVNILVVLFILSSCKKKGEITYPTSTNYGDNIFNLPDGKLIPLESYSMEANLGKNSTLTVKITNLSIMPTDIYVQKPRWAYDFVKGWKPDNVIDNVQNFTTQTIGNNDLKLVFIGTNGKCLIQTFINGGVEPSITKTFTW